MSNFFHRKTGYLSLFCFIFYFFILIDGKKNLAKTKGRQLSKDMIGLPQSDFIHAFHIGVSGMEKRIYNQFEKMVFLFSR
jgi:hypothetical protein